MWASTIEGDRDFAQQVHLPGELTYPHFLRCEHIAHAGQLLILLRAFFLQGGNLTHQGALSLRFTGLRF